MTYGADLQDNHKPDEKTLNKNLRTVELVKSFISISVIILFIALLGCEAIFPERVCLDKVMPYLTWIVAFVLGKYFRVPTKKHPPDHL